MSVEVVARTGRSGPVASGLEGRLHGTAVKGTSRVRPRGGSKVSVQRRIRGSAATNARGKSVRALGASKVLTIACAGAKTTRASKRTRAGGRADRAVSHVVRRSGIHRGRISRVSYHSSRGAASTTPKAVLVLGKVVVTANLVATLPVAGPERNDTRAAHAATAVSATVSVMANVVRGRAHHGRGAISIPIAHLAGGTSTNGRERATEARRASLEVGEAA